ncbi:MAG: dethiobiotin synthase [Desulfobulbus sp.]|jgi:dethiobiotin synthetase
MSRKQHTIVISGIDTDVGKSYATGLFARHLLQLGRNVTTLKLVQTGCEGPSEDIQLHRQLMGQSLGEYDRNGTTCPYTFPFPASPALSARMMGETIDPAVLDKALSTLQARFEWVLVEGAGGLMVPLTEEMVLLDYFEEKKYPLVLVCSPRLGSINHTRLSLEAIRARDIPFLGLVYNLFGQHPREIVQDTLAECHKALVHYGFADTVVIVPDVRESSAAAWQTLVEAYAAIDSDQQG